MATTTSTGTETGTGRDLELRVKAVESWKEDMEIKVEEGEEEEYRGAEAI